MALAKAGRRWEAGLLVAVATLACVLLHGMGWRSSRAWLPFPPKRSTQRSDWRDGRLGASSWRGSAKALHPERGATGGFHAAAAGHVIPRGRLHQAQRVPAGVARYAGGGGSDVGGFMLQAAAELDRRLQALESENKRLKAEVARLKDDTDAENKRLSAEVARLKDDIMDGEAAFSLMGLDFSSYEKGNCYETTKFTLAGITGLYLSLYPWGNNKSDGEHASLYITSSQSVKMNFRMTLDGTTRNFGSPQDLREGWGWKDFGPAASSFKRVSVKVLEVEH